MNTMSGRTRVWPALLLLAIAVGPACAQSGYASSGIVITKIDPPNWWANLPKPMLLVEGEHLEGAKFAVSDPSIAITRTRISDNGHWAELWLSASPAKPETVQIQAESNGARPS